MITQGGNHRLKGPNFAQRQELLYPTLGFNARKTACLGSSQHRGGKSQTPQIEEPSLLSQGAQVPEAAGKKVSPEPTRCLTSQGLTSHVSLQISRNRLGGALNLGLG